MYLKVSYFYLELEKYQNVFKSFFQFFSFFLSIILFFQFQIFFSIQIFYFFHSDLFFTDSNPISSVSDLFFFSLLSFSTFGDKNLLSYI